MRSPVLAYTNGTDARVVRANTNTPRTETGHTDGTAVKTVLPCNQMVLPHRQMALTYGYWPRDNRAAYAMSGSEIR
eukprot:2953629-Rhodomonas_salina.1